MPEMNSSNVKEDDELVDLGGGRGRPCSMGANESAWKRMGGDADGRGRYSVETSVISIPGGARGGGRPSGGMWECGCGSFHKFI
jgi:hypothetical protein